MQPSLELLIDRLSEKDVVPLEVPRLIRDVVHIIGAEDGASLTSLNEGLINRGWSEQVLDEDSFRIIMYLLETERANHLGYGSVH